jgi:drug/metabolite transporter (DMT)-like permease
VSAVTPAGLPADAPGGLDPAAVSPSTAATSRLVWIAMGIVYIGWGSTYFAIKLMVETMPPAMGAGLRFTVAGAVLLGGIALRRGIGQIRVSPRALAACALVGALLPACGNGLVTVAEQTISSGLAALLVASVPLWIVLLRIGPLRERVGARALVGVAVGFVGVAVLLGGGGEGHVEALGVALVLAAAIGWATGSVLSGRLPMPRDVWVATGWEMVFGGGILLAAATVTGEWSSWDVGATSLRSIGGWAWLVVGGSLITYSSYVWLLANVPIGLVGTYAFVNPVVAVTLGAAFLDEPVTASVVGGAAIVVASVALVVRSSTPRARRRARRPPGPRPAGG